VVSDRNDLDWLREREQKNRRDLPEDQKYTVYISPVFERIDPKEIVEYMKEYRLNQVRLQLQLHKFIWDPEKKGV
jgi:7-carboxy-7-deazaguanine synthase